MISAAEFELMVRRCLSHGVPSGIVADVFQLPPDVVHEAKKELTVAEYGTADQAEYTEWLQWKTLERIHWILENGSPADITKISTTVLGRQIASQGKRTPTSQTEAMARIDERMADMRSGDPVPRAPSRFVVGAAVPDDG